MTVSYPMNHAHLLVQRLLKLNPSTGPALHHIVLQGHKVESRDDTDRELPFRQESNFAWLTGVEVPGSAFTLSYEHEGGEFDAEKVKTTLHLPEVDPDEVMWCGLPPTASELQEKLSFSSVATGWTSVSLYPKRPENENLRTFIHTLPWTRPPTSVVSAINGPTSTTQFLIKALHEARRNKTPYEIEMMKKASEITGKAHTALMRAIGSGDVQDENAAEAVFTSTCRRMGAKHQAYTPIMAAGEHASTLHYVANDLEFPSQTGSFLLVDAGCEYRNYASDVTRCTPIGNGGRFTKESKEIYELVLEMQEAGIAQLKPGADWEKIQLLMHEVLIRGFLKLGIFVAGGIKGSEDEVVKAIMDAGVSNSVFPHGVGHLLGLDVHDVGGLPSGKSKHPLMKYLRLVGVPLEEGFVVTVEPGCYFNKHLMAPFVNSTFINQDKLAQYWGVGGVRIEDNLLITKDGYENLTPASLPKTVAEIEAVTTGQA